MRILLIEDDPELSAVIARQLEQNGFGVDIRQDGETGLLSALDTQTPYALVLLDRMLPVIDGVTILRAMRSKGIWTPVILITGLGELEDKLLGFDSGADDYLVKPFHMKELIARVKALARRPSEVALREDLTFGKLVLEPQRRRLSWQEKSLLLTQKEAAVLSELMKPGVHSRDSLLWQVWGSDREVEAGNIDNYIHFLRRKLRQLGAAVCIETVYGAGYRLEETP